MPYYKIRATALQPSCVGGEGVWHLRQPRFEPDDCLLLTATLRMNDPEFSLFAVFRQMGRAWLRSEVICSGAHLSR